MDLKFHLYLGACPYECERLTEPENLTYRYDVKIKFFLT